MILEKLMNNAGQRLFRLQRQIAAIVSRADRSPVFRGVFMPEGKDWGVKLRLVGSPFNKDKVRTVCRVPAFRVGNANQARETCIELAMLTLFHRL